MDPKLQVRIGGDASEVLTAFQKTEQASDRLTSAIARIGHYGVAGVAFTSVASFAAKASTALFEASVNGQRLETTLDAVTGGRSAQELGQLSSLTDKLGLNFLSTAKSYASFAAAARETALEGEGARKVFEAVSKASAVLGLSADDTSGVLRALQQMLSKGTVQSEELRGQLGERLPGAFQIAARAMGVTTRELGAMLERGEVLSADFLPRFAKQLENELGGAADKAGDRLEAATERMGNAWERLKQRMGDSGVSRAISFLAQSAANDMNAVADTMKEADAKGAGTFTQWYRGLSVLLGRAAGLQYVSDEFKDFNAQLAGTRQRVAELQQQVDKGGGGFYGNGQARRDLADAKARLQYLESIEEKMTGRGGVDTGAIERFKAIERATEQERIEALKRVEDSRVKFMTGYRTDSQRLADDLAAYRKQFAGKVSEEQQTLDEALIRKKYADKKKEKAPKDPLGDFILDKVNEQDRRDQAETARRLEHARVYGQQLVDQTDELSAQLITDERARAEALLAIDRRRMVQQLDDTKVTGDKRLELLAEIDKNIVARQRLLNEQLKPEWERMLDGWRSTTQNMQRFGDEFMTNWLRNGSETFQQWAATGKLTTRNLTGYIKSEFARLLYEQYLSQHMASVGKSLLGVITTAATSLFGGRSGSDPNGYNGTQNNPSAYVATPLAVGTNYVPYDGFRAELHEGEAVVPKKYNPAANGDVQAPAQINQTLNIGAGVNRGEVFAAVRAATAEMEQRLLRSRKRGGAFA